MVQRRLHQDIAIGDAVYRPAASFGAAVYPRDAHSYADLLSVADLAMYRAKSRTRGEAPAGPVQAVCPVCRPNRQGCRYLGPMGRRPGSEKL